MLFRSPKRLRKLFEEQCCYYCLKMSLVFGKETLSVSSDQRIGCSEGDEQWNFHHTVNNTCEDFVYTKRQTKDAYDSPCPLRHHRWCERNLIAIICDISMATVSWVGVFLLQNALKMAQILFNPTLCFLKIKLEMT